VYNDKFEFTNEKLTTVLGYSEEEIERLKSIQGKSSHSAWLTFMYPRLKLAQKLLSDDGVIFVSIDDNEQANLKLLMDDVFGESNFAGVILWQTATDNNPTQIATEHEYVLCYLKDNCEHDFWEIPSDKGKVIQEKYEELKITHTDIEVIQRELRKWIRKQTNGDDLSGVAHYSYVDEKGVFYPGNSSNTKPGGYNYDIIHHATKKVCAKPEYGYRWPVETFKKAAETGDVLWGDDEKTIPKIKKRLDTASQKLKSYYYEDNRATTGELKTLFDGIKVFNNPKSVNFLKHIFKFTTGAGDLILDFFAGSATTAQAVMQLNAEDGGNRKFIMVQIDEPTNPESEARKAKYNTIDEIARDRIKLAAKKIKADSGMFNAGQDLGFKHYRLATPDVQTIDKIIEFNPNDEKLLEDDMVAPFANIDTGTSGLETLLTTWLIDGGNSFDTPVEEVVFAGYKAHLVQESQTLYLIDQGFNIDALKDMLNKIGKREMAAETIVVYSYSFDFAIMRELEIGLNTLDNKPRLIKRY
jgi:hypothetical protein